MNQLVLYAAMMLYLVAGDPSADLKAATAGDVRSETELRAAFERRYHAWKAATESQLWRSDLATGKEFDEIAALGMPALPLIIERMEHGSGLDFLLGVAVSRITEKGFARDEYPRPEAFGDAQSIAKLYVKWWREGRGETPRLFAERYAAWRKYKESGQAPPPPHGLAEEERVLLFLGLDALPLMMEKIAAGDEDLPAIVNKLTRQALGDAPTRAQALEWWAANKEKWTLPPSGPAASAPTTSVPSTSAPSTSAPSTSARSIPPAPATSQPSRD